ncbi:hypothetical protein D0X99_04240 [Algoriphagus lacus]|uniref:Uncharacterized protein n=1 Tax=Algoriphagus lacus TaxID=2056311 RepID=A0A418PTU9_9BACT|nr:hypothetical protein [Algoriphagus lacus]RIW16991.1 hypothetical protein D0X99_04240 [Algoriphagus lacus]
MKKALILVSVITCLTLQAFGQVSESVVTKSELMEKSKRQKKTGFILLGGGLATAIGGGMLAFSSNPDSSSEDLGAGLFFLGVGSMVGGLVMWVISSSNQDRAEELTLGITPIDLPKETYVGPPGIPSLTLTIPLKGRK